MFCGLFVNFCLRHSSRANCAKITEDRPGQSAYDTFSIKLVFISFNFAPLCLRKSLYRGIKLGYILQNTRIQPFKQQQPCETVAPSGVCECILSTQCQLLGSVSLDFVRSGPSNMHCCRAFPFVLARLSCYCK